MGAEIVYLTGRDEPNMGRGTQLNLQRDGFPFHLPRTHLLMKPSFDMPDLDYKLSVMDFIRQRGDLVASFENEPPNVIAFQKIFPESMHIFVDTVCSEQPAQPGRGLYRIARYGTQFITEKEVCIANPNGVMEGQSYFE